MTSPASTAPLTDREPATLTALVDRLFPPLPDGTDTTAIGAPNGHHRAAYRPAFKALDESVDGDSAGAKEPYLAPLRLDRHGAPDPDSPDTFHVEPTALGPAL